VRGLADGWGVRTHAIEFLPVGAGGYHWAINDAWFVTVNVGTDVPALAHALDTAMVLRLPVVLAPADLRSPWTAGPYGEPARDLLRRHATRIRTWLAEFDTFAAAAGRTTNWAITHGEPHPGNILRTPAGPELIDGDTVRLAPPERDLWMLTSAMFGATPTRPPLAQPLRARHRPTRLPRTHRLLSALVAAGRRRHLRHRVATSPHRRP
jgi:hypothetical protein